MCFSPQAAVGGGLVICAIGVDAVRHVRQRREFLALAVILLAAMVRGPIGVKPAPYHLSTASGLLTAS
jgi:hypothetical protein